RKGERERTLDWYVVHIFPSDRLNHAAELARAAEAINRPFEARCWWELAAARPDQARAAQAELARLDRAAAEAGPPRTDPTPAELLAELEPTPGRPRPAPALTARPGGAMPQFVDGARAGGLDFIYDNGHSPLRQMPETLGGGVGLLDYDGDGWLDVYLVQGGSFPPPSAP